MKLVFPRLYAIMDSVLLRTSEIAFADILAASGVELIQYRNKQAPSGSLLQISLNLVKVLNQIGRAPSELQSQSNLVCRLLLEKKKKTQTNIRTKTTKVVHNHKPQVP